MATASHCFIKPSLETPIDRCSPGVSHVLSQVTRAVAHALLLLLAAFSLCFLLFQVVPGDPARVMLGVNASPEAVETLRQRLGLNRPLHEQYAGGLLSVSRGDFGVSLADSRPVAPLVLERLKVSGLIGGLACLIALPISLALTFLAFRVPGTGWLPSLVRLWIAAPAFLSAIVAAILVGTFIPDLPMSGYAIQSGGWWLALGPAIIVGLYPSASMTSILAARINSAQLTPHWRATRSLGFPRGHLFWRNGFSPALSAWAEAWFNQVSLVLFTTFLVEIVFSIPGIGALLLQSIQRKDLPLLQGIVLFNVILFITVRFAADLFQQRGELFRR